MESSQTSGPTNNYGDGLSIAFELVGTPVIFGFAGFWLDQYFGLTPWLTILVSVAALVTVVGLVIWRYNAEMDRADIARRASAASRPRRLSRWEAREAELAAEAAEAEAVTLRDASTTSRLHSGQVAS